MIFNSYGESVFDKALSASLFLVNNGSCAPQFTIPDSDFASLVETVPTPIVESYYECVLTWSDALTNAAGIASGNVAIIVPVILFMALPIIYLWMQCTGNVTRKPEYDKSEKELALDLLALNILRVRDNRSRGIKREGYLVNIARELVSAAQKADGGVIDSDDSDSEEEGEGGGGMQATAPGGRPTLNPMSRGMSFRGSSEDKSDPPKRRLSNKQMSFLRWNSSVGGDSDDEADAGRGSAVSNRPVTFSGGHVSGNRKRANDDVDIEMKQVKSCGPAIL